MWRKAFSTPDGAVMDKSIGQFANPAIVPIARVLRSDFRLPIRPKDTCTIAVWLLFGSCLLAGWCSASTGEVYVVSVRWYRV